MKIHYSLPTNEKFFNRYAALIPTLVSLGFIAQIVSAVTETGIIYSIIFSRVSEVAPAHAYLIALFGAITGTAFIEIGLRKFAPYSVKAVLYRRFKGLDLAMTVFIFCVCFGLLFTSAYLSFKGSRDLVEVAAPLPDLKDTAQQDRKHAENKKQILNSFAADKQATADSYDKRTEAEKSRFNSLIDEQKAEIRKYTRKELKTGASYQTRIERSRKKIAAYRVQQTEKTAALERERAAAVQLLTDRRRTDLNRLESTYANEVADVKKENQTTVQTAAAKVSKYGNGLAWFTILCVLVFLFSVVLEQIHKKGSGIEQTALPNQYYFSQSVFSEFAEMVSDKMNFYFRNKINRLAYATPPPPIPAAPPDLYDLTAAKQRRLLFTLPDEDTPQFILNSPLPDIESRPTVSTRPTESAPPTNEPPADIEQTLLQYLKTYLDLKKCSLDTAAAQVQLKADEVIKAYLGKAATAAGVTALRAQIIGFLKGQNPNPFSTHHRQTIGFNKPTETNTETTIRKSLNENSAKPQNRTCTHCKNEYTYRHHKQKYCSDTCRIDAWQARTGKTLKLKKKKG